ncbi:CaiB/BaiF CoA-transferase family protein [Chelatococcus reniformis]|uniref:CoA transferase n=1 Tax=Chelatococcus reniformis TaxID=1494448 RepID=A0A916UFW6_9HYPH|nr:CoA transferase [Chelatococcus reniformis]GGC72051.1 CoA transferase [Chelatococcus reniformis]
MTAPLSDLTVLEVSGDIATRYCGKLFAQHGAQVIRSYVPDNGHVGFGGAASAAYGAWLDSHKEFADGVPVSLEPDLVIAGQTPADIARAQAIVAGMKRRPLLLALTWFGETGPYAGWHGSDGVVQAMSGLAYSFGPIGGPPTLPQGHAPQIVAGATAYIATLAALIGRRQGRAAARVDLSVLEAYICLTENSGPGFAHDAVAAIRRGINRFSPTYPQTIYRASDGWIGVTALTPQQWQALCDMIGLSSVGRDPAYATTDQRMAAADEVDALLAPALLNYSSVYLLLEGQKRRVPMGPVPTMAELLRTPHWRDRDSFATFNGTVPAFEGPATPFRLHARGGPGAPTPRRSTPDGAGPLAGVRVLDLSMGWSGPLCGRHYADLGADVIKVEGCTHPDWWRGWNGPEAGEPPPYEIRSNFNAMNRNKRGITLDLRDERGCEILRRLAPEADLLIENYAPGVLDRLGLSADALARINPDLVYVSMGAFGSSGPWSGFRAYGSTTEQASGFCFVNGAADWAPCLQHIAYGDPIAGIYAAIGSLTALYGRPVTGGTTVDLSQVESLFQLAADAIVAQSVTGEAPARNGSRRAAAFWRGCLPCAAEDSWIAVDVVDGEALAAFLREAGLNPSAAADADRLAALLGGWAADRSPAAAAEAMQAAGIAAGAVIPAHTLLDDPHLLAAGYWRRLERRYVGEHIVPKPPFAIDGLAPPAHRPAPTLGEHTGEVLRETLGLADAELQALARDGAIGMGAR